MLHPSFCVFAIGRGHFVLMSPYFRVRSYDQFFFHKNKQVFLNDVFRARIEKRAIFELNGDFGVLGSEDASTKCLHEWTGAIIPALIHRIL